MTSFNATMNSTQSPADWNKEPMDRLLTILLISILSFGLVMLYSASVGISDAKGGFYYLQRQLIAITLGGFLMFTVMYLPLSTLRFIARYGVIVAALLLIMVFLPGVGKRVNGAMRWIGSGGFHFQPAEFAKIAMIAYVADFVHRRPMIFRGKIIDQWPLLFIIGVLAVLLRLQPDHGTIMVIVMIVATLMILGGMKAKVWLPILLLAFLGGLVLYFLAPYVQKRFDAFLDPLKDPHGDSWQLINALIAAGRGGWSGVGLGESVQKVRYLPEVHTDFILAMIGEEIGFIGVTFFLLLYGLFIGRLFVLAQQSAERLDIFGTFIIYGVAIWLAVQLLINVAVNFGWFPTKGLTLPMISYGSSSMMMIGLALGFVFNVQRHRRNPNSSPSVYQMRQAKAHLYRTSN